MTQNMQGETCPYWKGSVLLNYPSFKGSLLLSCPSFKGFFLLNCHSFKGFVLFWIVPLSRVHCFWFAPLSRGLVLSLPSPFAKVAAAFTQLPSSCKNALTASARVGKDFSPSCPTTGVLPLWSGLGRHPALFQRLLCRSLVHHPSAPGCPCQGILRPCHHV